MTESTGTPTPGMGTSLSFTSYLPALSERKATSGYHVVAGMPLRRHEADQGWEDLMLPYVPGTKPTIRQGASAHGDEQEAENTTESFGYYDPSDSEGAQPEEARSP